MENDVLENEETKENEVVEPEVVNDESQFNIDLDGKDVAIGVAIGTAAIIGVTVLVKKVVVPGYKKLSAKAKDLFARAKKKTEKSEDEDGEIINPEVVDSKENSSMKN